MCRLILALIVSGVTVVGKGHHTQSLPDKAGQECRATPDRVAHQVEGEVKGWESFERPIGRFIIRLSPERDARVELPVGWLVGVFEQGRDDDLARFTLPMMGPNPRDLLAWTVRGFMPSTREFVFSPEVGRTILFESGRMVEKEKQVGAYGRGKVKMVDFEIVPGDVPAFRWLKFDACVTYPRER